MGRLFSLLVVGLILVPFFAAADQVDVARRQQVAALLSHPADAHAMRFGCRPTADTCDQDD